MRPTQHQSLQRAYYARTAGTYEDVHVGGRDIHQLALAWLRGVIDTLEIRSVLDIGSGTGWAVRELKAACPGVKVVGIEPSPELREIGYAHGIGRDELIDGDVFGLDYPDGAFDLVIEFATLHHVPDPSRAVAEMLRVARRGIFLSDSNKFGQGSPLMRRFKGLVRIAGLWNALDWVRTRGKGYHWSEGDGLFYSYSVFDNHGQIAAACPAVYVMNTVPSGIDIRSSAAHVALLGLKEPLEQ